MTVSSQTNNETFDGNGVTTIWDLPFRFFDNADIDVYLVDNATQTTTPLVLGTDYTLTGAGLPEQFGTAPGKITTTVPVAIGTKLYVERVLEIEQLIDIVNQGRFFPEVHEDAFDRLTMLIQQANATVRGAIRVALTDPEPARLPAAGLRANLLMAFDGLGNPIAVAPTPDSSTALALMLANDTLVTQGAAMLGRGGQVVKSIAELKTLLVNTPSKHAFVTGYYTQGDGGGGPYWLDSTDTTSADNGGTIIVAADGGRWKRAASGALSVKVFGAKGDNATDDNAAVNAAITWLSLTGGELYFPTGVYLCTQVNWTITTTSFYGARISLRGDGPALSVIKAATVATDQSLMKVTANTGVAVNSLIFGAEVANMGFEVSSVTGNVFTTINSAYMKFDNCYFSGGNRTFNSEGCLSSTFVNCKFAYGRYGFYAVGGFSFPNQLSFFQCVVGSNTVGGIYAKNPGGIRFYGGSIEGNGASGPSGFGVIIDHAAATSSGTAIGCVFDGTYFEFNNGIADIYIGHNNAFENLSFSVDNCSFACGGAMIVTDRVKVEHLSATALTGHVSGCNFSELSGFAPTTGQKYINVTGGGVGPRNVSANDNYYNAANSVPVAGTVRTAPASLSKRVEGYSGTTNASGILTIALSGFTAAPSVSAMVTDGTASLVYSVRRTASSASSATFEVMKQAFAGGAWTAAGTVNLSVVAVGS